MSAPQRLRHRGASGRPTLCDWSSLAGRLTTEPAAEIAAELGCHQRSVENARRRLGLPAPRRNVRRWTAREERVLTMQWGVAGIDQIARLLPGRTLTAISWRARQMGLGAVSQRAGMSMREAATYLGWEQCALHRAARALGIPLRRMPRTSTDEPRPTHALDARGRRSTRRYALSDDVVDQLGAWLAEHGAHGRVLGPGGPAMACAECGRTGLPHAGRGLCAACYQRHRAATGKKLRPAEARLRWLGRTCEGCGAVWDVPEERRRGAPPRHCDACRASGRGWALPESARRVA